MHRYLLATLSLAAVAAFSQPSLACDAKTEVEAAFNAQHKGPWRTQIESKSDTGIVQTQQFDFLPPDRIYRKVTSGDDKTETIGIGELAWTNEGAGWIELKKGVADLVVNHLRTTLAPAKVAVEFKCLDKITYEGKSYIGYQTVPETVQGKMMARTILVDPEAKRPAFNIIAAPDLSGEPLSKEAYSYPDGIAIEKPI